jgi:hypothetical protein
VEAEREEDAERVAVWEATVVEVAAMADLYALKLSHVHTP